MKFSHSLQLNTSPEWREHYIAYSKLKKITYILEKAVLGTGKFPKNSVDLQVLMDAPSPQVVDVENPATTTEATPFLQSERSSTNFHEAISVDEANKFFTTILDEELEKIKDFYAKKESNLLIDLQGLALDITKSEKQEETYLHSLWNPDSPALVPLQPPAMLAVQQSPRKPQGAPSALDAWDAAPPDNQGIQGSIARSEIASPGFLPFLIWSSASLKSLRQQLMKRAVDLFVLFCELRDFVDINETGFSKVLKKYEKVLGAKVKVQYLQKVEEQYPFLASTKTKLDQSIEVLTQWYARIATDGKIQIAQGDLKSHLREHIVWERNTIWRDMVEQERRHETIGFIPNTIGGEPTLAKTVKIMVT